jgi:hypothetical protein
MKKILIFLLNKVLEFISILATKVQKIEKKVFREYTLNFKL